MPLHGSRAMANSSTVVAFKRPKRQPLAGADRLAASHVIHTVGRALAARPKQHPTIRTLFMQFLSVARGLNLFPPLHPIRRTTDLFSESEMQNMLDGLDRLIEIARPCRDTTRAVAAAKKLRRSLECEYWNKVRARESSQDR
jgi:hypothetical protein